jgi:DNA-binding CsgD family transcriptional regulator
LALEAAVPADVGRLFWRLRHQHPVCVYQDVTQDFAARKLSDFVTGRELHRLEIDAEFFRPYGVEHELDVGLPAPPTHTKVFLFDSRGVDFDERDRLLLDLLRPHLGFLYLAARDRRVVAALEATGEARRSVLVLGRAGRIEFVGADARGVLDRSIPHHAGRLPDTLADWVRHDATPPGDARGLMSPRRPFTIERTGRRLVVRRVGRVLLLREEHATLTRREQEVLDLAAAGRSNAEIARELFIAPGTVRIHLQHAYEKLGVRNRTAAAALLARGA